MDDSEIIRDILLKEYAEAGSITRQHEQLTRTSVSILVPTLLALAGYLMQSSTSPGAKSILATGGVAVSLLMLNIVRRHQIYYCNYIARARQIEKELKVQNAQILRLYSLGEYATKKSRTISNKQAFSVFSLIATVFFLISAILFGYEFIREICP